MPTTIQIAATHATVLKRDRSAAARNGFAKRISASAIAAIIGMSGPSAASRRAPKILITTRSETVVAQASASEAKMARSRTKGKKRKAKGERRKAKGERVEA